MTGAAPSVTHGWLTVGSGAIAFTVLTPVQPTSRACLILPSVGHENLSMHRGLVALARQLSTDHLVGMVQHWGTDQSTGSVDDDHLIDRWIAGLGAALDELRRRGAAHITVVAPRLGAILATNLLPRAAVDSLVLWSPVVSGHRFVRTLTVLEAAGRTVVDSGDGINVAGFRYPQPLLDDLARRTAPTETPPAAHVLVVDDAAQPCSPAFIDALRQCGTQVEHVQSPDIATWIRAAQFEMLVPEQSIARITEWMRATTATAPDQSAVAHTGNSQFVDSLALATGGSESVISLRPRYLCAVRSAPDGAGPEGAGPDGAGPDGAGSEGAVLPVGLVLDSTIGPGRAYVDLARWQTSKGRVVVRYDFAGYRWSPNRREERHTFEYDADDRADLESMVGSVSSMVEHGVVAVGFCGGANLLLRRSTLASVLGIVSINPPLYDLAIDPDRKRTDRTVSTNPIVRRSAYLWRFVIGTRAAKRRIDAALKQHTRLLFLFDAVDTGLTFWNTRLARRYRTAVATGSIAIETLPNLGHNLEGADLRIILERIDTFIEQVSNDQEQSVV